MHTPFCPGEKPIRLSSLELECCEMPSPSSSFKSRLPLPKFLRTSEEEEISQSYTWCTSTTQFYSLQYTSTHYRGGARERWHGSCTRFPLKVTPAEVTTIRHQPCSSVTGGSDKHGVGPTFLSLSLTHSLSLSLPLFLSFYQVHTLP